MTLLAQLLVGFLAVLHLGFMYLEMVMVRQPAGQKIFQLTPELSERMVPLFANQGLYNGFLVAGLVWGLLHPNAAFGVQLQVFFVGCVVVAGLFGGLTTLRSILYLQALPGLLALGALWLAHGR